MAHVYPIAGHLDHKKMTGLLKWLYTWPGIGKTMLACCRSCAKYQKVKSSGEGMVPLHPLPVIEEPNNTMTVDIVGPSPRSKVPLQLFLFIVNFH